MTPHWSDRARELLAAATPGPWVAEDDDIEAASGGAIARVAHHASQRTIARTGEEWKERAVKEQQRGVELLREYGEHERADDGEWVCSARVQQYPDGGFGPCTCGLGAAVSLETSDE